LSGFSSHDETDNEAGRRRLPTDDKTMTTEEEERRRGARLLVRANPLVKRDSSTPDDVYSKVLENGAS